MYSVKVPLRSAFAASHRLWIVMSLVSLASWDLQISSLVSPALPWLLSSMLSSFRALVFVAIVFLVVDFEPHSVGFIQAVG